MSDNQHRQCADCGLDKRPYRRGRCPACNSKMRYHQDPDRANKARYLRAYYLEHKYGMTIQQYDDMLESQGGRCAICRSTDPGSKGRFCVDHDHQCCPGEKACSRCIRGLLCNACNVGLAHFGDDPERLLAAASYVGS